MIEDIGIDNKTYGYRAIMKFKVLSDKHHNMSLLFNELAKSLEIEIKKRNIERSPKKIKEYLKELNLDFDKIEKITRDTSNITLKDLKKNGNIK